MSQVQLHCHHCQRWLGECRESLTFAGMFKDPRQRERVEEPRDTWRCKSCGWANVFVSVVGGAVRDYRPGIEFKRAS